MVKKVVDEMSKNEEKKIRQQEQEDKDREEFAKKRPENLLKDLVCHMVTEQVQKHKTYNPQQEDEVVEDEVMAPDHITGANEAVDEFEAMSKLVTAFKGKGPKNGKSPGEAPGPAKHTAKHAGKGNAKQGKPTGKANYQRMNQHGRSQTKTTETGKGQQANNKGGRNKKKGQQKLPAGRQERRKERQAEWRQKVRRDKNRYRQTFRHALQLLRLMLGATVSDWLWLCHFDRLRDRVYRKDRSSRAHYAGV